MKRMLALLIMAIVLLFVGEIEADAAPYNVAFSDNINQNHWPSWGKGSQNNQDVIGNPNISGGNAIISQSGHLKRVNFLYTSTDLGDYIPPGDLFIDVGADNDWDYVITTSGIDNKGNDNASKWRSFDYDFDQKVRLVVYSFDSGFSALKGDNDDYYEITPRQNGLRRYHPVALSDTGASNASGIVDYTVTADDGFYYWDLDYPGEPEKKFRFKDFSLDLLGQDFILGFSPDCANDVIYAKINNPVPIPTSILLFGSGLIGLVGIRRRKVRVVV